MANQRAGSSSRSCFVALSVFFHCPDARCFHSLFGVSRPGLVWARRAVLSAVAVMLAAAITAPAQVTTLLPAWNQMSPANSPPARFNHATA